jgi:hypothetical protein
MRCRAARAIRARAAKSSGWRGSLTAPPAPAGEPRRASGTAVSGRDQGMGWGCGQVSVKLPLPLPSSPSSSAFNRYFLPEGSV